MAADFDAKNLDGFAHWMRAQAQEEWGHGMKMYKYITEQQGRVTLEAIDAPKTEWATAVEIFEETYKHEQLVTSKIHDLMALAKEEKDYATEIFLQWFVNEQVEEEAHASSILEKMKLIGESPQGLIMMDRGLGEGK